MTKSLSVLLSIFFGFTAWAWTQEDPDVYIFPDPNRKIIIVAAEKKEGKLLAGKELPASDPLAAAARRELAIPYHASLIKLDQCSRNLAGDSSGPNILFLSQTEGGFPRTGIQLTTLDGKVETYPHLNYVDLVLSRDRIENGEMDIYSHELGHVMMNNLLQGFWDAADGRTSPKQHVSMGVTDYFTAFYEGWGIHFQRLAYDRIPKYQDLYTNSHYYDRAPGFSWHSNIDTELRIRGVLQNVYIYRKLLPQGIDSSRLDAEEMILLEHTSPLFDPTRIKNGQEMMSCEGVIATLFYHIQNNPALQKRYAPKEFYNRFLLEPLPDSFSPDEFFSPEENLVLKCFWVWHVLERKGSAEPPMISFIEQWGREFPEDKEELLSVFTALTRGRTISNQLAELSQRIQLVGQIGDYGTFRSLLPEYREIFSRIVAQALENPNSLIANIGPELWVTHPDFKIRAVLWSEEPLRPLAVNINAASFYELSAFLGRKKAGAFLKLRDEYGFFTSLEQAEKLGFVFH